jgi:2-amino-4-hydroxy-6-hydroxymethyldihydropteridine diphosphokinase
MYVEDQPPFLNAAVACSTTLSPRAVLTTLKRLEQEIGRAPRERNGPREIDLDLVAYGQLSYQYTEEGILKLTVPHQAMAERRFVLQPLSDIAPNSVIPGLGSVASLLARTEHQRDHVITLSDALL